MPRSPGSLKLPSAVGLPGEGHSVGRYQAPPGPLLPPATCPASLMDQASERPVSTVPSRGCKGTKV